jgi:hypothetical protein
MVAVYLNRCSLTRRFCSVLIGSSVEKRRYFSLMLLPLFMVVCFLGIQAENERRRWEMETPESEKTWVHRLNAKFRRLFAKDLLPSLYRRPLKDAPGATGELSRPFGSWGGLYYKFDASACVVLVAR